MNVANVKSAAVEPQVVSAVTATKPAAKPAAKAAVNASAKATAKPAVKVAVKVPTKPAVKATTKAAAKTATKPATKTAAKVAAKPAKRPAAKAVPAAKANGAAETAPKIRKPKLVQATITLHADEHTVLKDLKAACKLASTNVKKSELMRAALTLLKTIDVAAIKVLVERLPALKPEAKKKA